MSTEKKEADNPRHPGNIPEGDVRTGTFLKEPTVGEKFWCGHNWRTSIVQEIIDENTFRTLNSIYTWEYI